LLCMYFLLTSMDQYCICYSMYFCYCTHGCVCQLVIKENDDDDDDVTRECCTPVPR